MTHLLLPQMLNRYCVHVTLWQSYYCLIAYCDVYRQKGVIINICASIAVIPPTPLLTVYQAAMVSINKETTQLLVCIQSYVNSLSQALHYECAGRGVMVQVRVCIGHRVKTIVVHIFILSICDPEHEKTVLMCRQNLTTLLDCKF